jgi:hypothetical protein
MKSFREESEHPRTRDYLKKSIKRIDADDRFSLSNLSDNCYIIYNTVQDDNGNNMISILSFECNSQIDSSISKGDGRILMNAFLHYYLKKNNIPEDQNLQIVLTAVSPNQKKLNQYYKDIGFQLLESFTRHTNFKGNVNDVLYYTEHYEKNAKGKKTRHIRKSKKKRTNRRSK